MCFVAPFPSVPYDPSKTDLLFSVFSLFITTSFEQFCRCALVALLIRYFSPDYLYNLLV